MDSPVVAAIVGIGGVIIGSILTLLTQWVIAKRQRSWSIGDQMKQKRYERLLNKVNTISEQIGLKTTILMDIESTEMGESTISNEHRGNILKQIENREGEVQSALMATGSEELRKLFNTLNKYYYSTLAYHDLTELNKAWDTAQAVHRKMEELLDETLLRRI